MDQRRMLLALGLSLLLLMLYQELVLKRYQPAEEAAPSEERTATAPPPDRPGARPAEPVVIPPAFKALSAPAELEDSVLVETDLVRARITRVGARLIDFELKQFRRSIDPDSEPLELVAPAPVLPLTLQLGADAADAAVVYKADRSELILLGGERGEVTLTAESPEGRRFEKRYTFTGDSYLFELRAAVAGGDAPKAVGLVLTPLPSQTAGDASREVALALADRKVIEKHVTELPGDKPPAPIKGSRWAGFAAQYFLTVAIPLDGPGAALMTGVGEVPIVNLEVPLVEGRAAFGIFAGPKSREILERADHGLERALDFGWFWFIAIPLLQALRALHVVIGNYGVAIIVLTTLVKLATVPLTQVTFRSMKEMQKLQPQMAKLRERFKDDQAALQKEMMELYRRHRVNPLSGCLPMLLQLPIFVGLYNTLSHAIELRHAPFALWITDLSAPDRLYVAGIGIPVLTFLMGGSMFLQQWISPQQGDPTQQRMMMIMPLVFTFTLINFPSGLVLYWLVNNLLSIAQQWFMLRSKN